MDWRNMQDQADGGKEKQGKYRPGPLRDMLHRQLRRDHLEHLQLLLLYI
jgi:hypothetical protein